MKHPLHLMPLPSSPRALIAERDRLERELAATSHSATRRLLAIERRRVVIAQDVERS